MVNPTAVLNKISSVLIRKDLSKSLLVNQFEMIENRFKEKERSFVAQEVVKGIVLDYERYKRLYDKAGKYDTASFIVLFPVTANIEEEWTIEFDNKEFEILGIKSSMLQEKKMLYRLFVSEIQDIDKC